WLEGAARELARAPAGVIRHALLLTDGRNEGESDDHLRVILEHYEGRFQCDARGVGTHWTPDQPRMITGQLVGAADIIPSPAEMEADFRRVVETALGKAVGDVFLRLWTPQGAEIEFCCQVYPEKVDLTRRARPVPGAPQVHEYPTGSWGAEKRDYHFCIRV